MKNAIVTTSGVIGSALAYFFGGWDSALAALCIFMLIDYATGFLVAWLFHASKKSENGGLDSKAGVKGLAKKCMVLVLVGVANLLDMQMGTDYLRSGVCIAFMVNEVLSIVENAALMGVPIPKLITDALEILQDKHEGES